MNAALIALLVVALFVLIVVLRSVRIVPQARAAVIERLGRYIRTQATPGHQLCWWPFVDRMRPLMDLREQVVSFPPQPVITEDNLTVAIDSVIYFQVTDPRSATYEIANYIQAVEQLTITTLRNVVGALNLEQALTSRDEHQHRNCAGCWTRPPAPGASGSPGWSSRRSTRRRPSRTRWRSRCGPTGTSGRSILQAEGQRESAIKSAEGQKAAQILTAEGQQGRPRSSTPRVIGSR